MKGDDKQSTELNKGVAKPRQGDRDLSTRKLCLYGLGLSWVACLLGITAVGVLVGVGKTSGILILAGTIPVNLDGGSLIVLPLILATILTSCNECLGYIHATALRWALWHEGRLNFNTNLRLLTQAKTSKPNTWYVNVGIILLTAVSYAAAGAAIIPENRIYVPAISLMVLCLLLQAIIATWTLLTTKDRILSWSANALNNSLICQERGLQRHIGQCMTPFQRTATLRKPRNNPSTPSPQQLSLTSSRFSAVVIMSLLWALVLLSFLWACLVGSFGVSIPMASPGDMHHGYALSITASTKLHAAGELAGCFISIALLLATQILSTFSLHCTELLVNSARDEGVWRRAANLKRKGATISVSALKEASTSWETLILFVLKSAIHWSYGEAIKVNFYEGYATASMWQTPLFILAGLTTICALFATYLCLKRPRDPQPTAYGHLQTLVNLIDDWGVGNEPLFWGDKGHVGWDAKFEIRHAGTAGSKEKVGEIDMKAKYV